MRISKIARRRVRTWAGLFGLVSLIGVLNFITFVTDRLANRLPPHSREYLIYELTGAYLFFVLLPLLYWFFRTYPLHRENLVHRIPLYLAVSLLYGISHTLLMYFSRVWIFRMLGLGIYDYGEFGYRVIMEYSKQFLIFWIVCGVVTAIGILKKVQEEQLRAAGLEQQLTKARLQTLQMQVNPHFLFNTLNMISARMYENVKAADRMVVNLSDLLRATLKKQESEEHTLAEELEFAALYTDIMKARYEDKLEIVADVDPALQRALIPRFLLQPLLENSIKFGIENVERARVTIVARAEGTSLIVSVQDNGPGFGNAAERKRGEGIGVANTVERLETLYGRAHRFETRSLATRGCMTLIRIPLRFCDSAGA